MTVVGLIRYHDPIQARDDYREYLASSATPDEICRLLTKAKRHLHPKLMMDSLALQSRIEDAVAEAAELIIISGVLDRED